MQITLTDTEYCKLSLAIELDDQIAIANTKKDVMEYFKKNAKVSGFRPGHASDLAIMQNYKKELKEQLQQTLAEKAIREAVIEKGIKVVGRPTLTSISMEESLLVGAGGTKPIKFKCEFSLYKQPDFDLVKETYFEMAIPRPADAISPDELAQKIIQELREKNGNTVSFTEGQFAQNGDTVVVNFKTTLGGVVIDELTAETQLLKLGQINISGFSENLLGMNAGETREFDLVMPADYKPEYAGKTLHFEVKLITGSKTEPLAADDNLAKAVGLETYDKLMEQVISTANSRVEETRKMKTLEQITRKLVASYDFVIPTWITASEAQLQAKAANVEWEKISDEEKEKHIDNSEKSVKLALILSKIREVEIECQLTDEETINVIRKNLSSMTDDVETVLINVFKSGNLPLLANRAKDEYVLDYIYKNVKFIE